MTTPTDPKALAEEALALAKHLSWLACFGLPPYVQFIKKEDCHELESRVEKLARAVLALDAENQRLLTVYLDREEQDGFLLKRMIDENQRLRAALERVHMEALLLYPNQFPDIPAYQQIILDTIYEALERKP